jgi:predicted nucleotidyltransferase
MVAAVAEKGAANSGSFDEVDCSTGRFELPVLPSGTINPMKPSDSFRAHREALREIIARHGVTRPRVFGSAARGEDHEGSDLDLLVEPASTTTLFTLAALQIEAERLLGVSVDVLTPRSLPAGSRERILREAVPV